MLHAIAIVWIVASIGACWGTWFRIRGMLMSGGASISTWDQWANFGAYLQLMRSEKDPAQKKKYSSALRAHILSCASALAAFALMVYTEAFA